jgi:hypothetical protein
MGKPMFQLTTLHRIKETMGIFLLSGLISCAHQSAAPKTIDPMTEALSRSQEGLYQSIITAIATEEAQEEISFLVRFNPAPCECPDWEMNYRQRWQRVLLIHEIDDAAPDQGTPFLSSPANENAVIEILGYFGETSTHEETDLSYRTIHISDLVSPKSPTFNSN